MQVRVTTTGRRSRVARTVTLYAWEDGDDLLLVGSWAGRPQDPAWVHNLRASGRATVERGRGSIDMSARELAGDERERAWKLVVDRFPMYETFQRKTDRRIPVFRLRPTSP